ncbi:MULTISPECIES: YitT family protein [unclassified Moraxella]|uniref:YitT family protein n=1 Tax=unclassified Moraxella TaxID=2685852 RepID=UPI003AF85F2B
MTDSTTSADTTTDTNDNNISHSLMEDAFAVTIGTSMIGFALLLLQHSHVMVGGTAGLSLLIQKATALPFGVVFWLLNLPFYVLAYLRLGKQMVIKTLIAVTTLSLMTELHPHFVSVGEVQPLYASIFANVLIGVGILILFRHRASLGGFNIIGLYAQHYLKIPAGKVMLFLDGMVLLASLWYVSWQLIAISILGMVVLNAILTINHRQDRYVAY